MQASSDDRGRPGQLLGLLRVLFAPRERLLEILFSPFRGFSGAGSRTLCEAQELINPPQNLQEFANMAYQPPPLNVGHSCILLHTVLGAFGHRNHDIDGFHIGADFRNLGLTMVNSTCISALLALL